MNSPKSYFTKTSRVLCNADDQIPVWCGRRLLEAT